MLTLRMNINIAEDRESWTLAQPDASDWGLFSNFVPAFFLSPKLDIVGISSFPIQMSDLTPALTFPEAIFPDF